MKKIITLTLAFASIFSFNAQQEAPPQGINYQAVAVDNTNKEIVGTDVAAKPVADKEIRVRFSILKTSETGTLTYREVHLVTTDAYGLFNTVIGQGIQDASPNAFNQIDWGTGYHFLKVEIDITGGTDYKDMGTQQLWSVPYALYSKYADAAGNGIDSVTDNGDGTITFTYIDGSTYTTSPLTGLQGPAGPAGANGQDGLSAYEIWLSQGNSGTEADFLAGMTGPQGSAGAIGQPGPAGTNGSSAYQVAVNNGYVGTEAQWLASLQGATGPTGASGAAGTNGATGLTGATGPTGPAGAAGTNGTNGATGLTGATGPAGLLTNGTTAGNTPYWDGTAWVVNSSNIHNNGGNIGIGSPTPTSKLEVNGAATNTTAFNAGSSSSIDFAQSNLAYTSATGTAITLQNLKNGGAYTLIFTNNTASGTVTFTASGLTFVQMGTFARTAGKKHIYNFVMVGTEVYVTMAREN